MAHRLDRHFRIGVGGVAQRIKPLLTEPAIAAADGEGNDDAVADRKIGHFGPERHDLAHIFMAQDITALHRRHIAVDQVEIRAANGASVDLDDGIAGMLDFGVGNGVDANIAFSMITNGAHEIVS